MMYSASDSANTDPAEGCPVSPTLETVLTQIHLPETVQRYLPEFTLRVVGAAVTNEAPDGLKSEAQKEQISLLLRPVGSLVDFKRQKWLKENSHSWNCTADVFITSDVDPVSMPHIGVNALLREAEVLINFSSTRIRMESQVVNSPLHDSKLSLLRIPIGSLASTDLTSGDDEEVVSKACLQALKEVSESIADQEFYLSADGVTISTQQPYDCSGVVAPHTLPLRPQTETERDVLLARESHVRGLTKDPSNKLRNELAQVPVYLLEQFSFWDSGSAPHWLQSLPVVKRRSLGISLKPKPTSDAESQTTVERSQGATESSMTHTPFLSCHKALTGATVSLSFSVQRPSALHIESSSSSGGHHSLTNLQCLTRIVDMVRAHVESATPGRFSWLDPSNQEEMQQTLMRSCLLMRLYQRPFPSPFFSRVSQRPVTRRELKMVQAMGAIRDKPLWWQKVNSASLCHKWGLELQRLQSVPDNNVSDGQVLLLSKRCLLYMWQELRWWARRYEADVSRGSMAVQPSAVDGAFQCDDEAFMPATVRKRLLAGIEAIERSISMSGAEPDVHPDSNGQVINLVHPSMHCLRIGPNGSHYAPREIARESTWSSMGSGVQQSAIPYGKGGQRSFRLNSRDEDVSTQFAWLPADLQLSERTNKDATASKSLHGGGVTPPVRATFLSYINGLHPSIGPEAELYPLLEDLIARFVPMWELVLANLTIYSPQSGRRILAKKAQGTEQADEIYRSGLRFDSASRMFSYSRFEYASDEEKAAWLKVESDEERKLQLNSGEQAANSSLDSPALSAAIDPSSSATDSPYNHCSQANLNKPLRKWDKKLWDEHDVPKPFSLPKYIDDEEPFRLQRFGRLQVIIKISTIVLTPEKPNYPGGAMHIEGMSNERIVASGIYYLENVNISESRLAFRHAVASPDDYDNFPEDEDVFNERTHEYSELYDLHENQTLNQLLGSVQTRAGRALAWHNCLQHQVQPFSLIDPTKPGHRRIVVAFLVDPAHYVPSTLLVPPQQREWLILAATHAHQAMMESTPLPIDLINLCLDYLLPLGDSASEESEQNKKRVQYEAWQSEIEALQQTDGQLSQKETQLVEQIERLTAELNNTRSERQQVQSQVKQRQKSQEKLGFAQSNMSVNASGTASSSSIPIKMNAPASSSATHKSSISSSDGNAKVHPHTVSLDLARFHRLELMKERKFFKKAEEGQFEEIMYRERPVSLCEH